MKYPLTLYIVWHPAFTEGKIIANNIYSIFCRDTEKPLSRGLGIPVYNRSVSTGKIPIAIDPSNSKRNAIILLIDKNYYVDDNFREYTASLMKLISDNTRIYPVSLCEQATDFGQGLNSFQFLRAFKGGLTKEEYSGLFKKDTFGLEVKEDFDLAMKKIKTELLHDCARLLMNFHPIWQDKDNKAPSPVTLFLSHAKFDGLESTKRFKAFIDAELKLDVFFDTVDIADSYEFEQQIESNIKKSAFVVFQTDEYSAREWCRIEVLIAKRNKCSIVVVNDVKNGEKRAFPYLGNTPTITIQQDEKQSFYEIVNLTLIQVLNNLFQKELLEVLNEPFKTEGTEFISLTSPPELFNYIDIYKKKEESKKHIVVLYPEPPLGAEELKLLNEIDANISFLTPINLPSIKL